MYSPVVHEDVWFPNFVGRYPDVFYVSVLRCVPLQIDIRPFLDSKIKCLKASGEEKVSFKALRDFRKIYVILLQILQCAICDALN